VARDIRASQSLERGRESRCNRPSGRERKKREIDENERDEKEDGKLARRGGVYSRLGGEGRHAPSGAAKLPPVISYR